VLAAGGTNRTLDPANEIASSGVWNDTEYPKQYNMLAGGGGLVGLILIILLILFLMGHIHL